MLSSLRLTLVGMAGLAAMVLLSYRFAGLSASWVALPLIVLSINLLAALVTKPQFRRQGGLLAFHLCLLAILLLTAFGLLTRLQGHVEIAEGQAFDSASVVVTERGLWHPWRLETVRFLQGPIQVSYRPEWVRGSTRSQLAVPDDQGKFHTAQIGDTESLQIAGYRFVTTFNKGYAVLLTWLGERGDALAGAVHMPSYPLLEWKQQNRWRSPAGQDLNIELKLPKPPLEQAWTLTSAGVHGRILVSGAGQPIELEPGQVLAAAGGVLRFDGLRLWMGYRIDYNPALPWLFSAAIVGILGLAWHFWRKFWRAPSAVDDARHPLSWHT